MANTDPADLDTLIHLGRGVNDHIAVHPDEGCPEFDQRESVDIKVVGEMNTWAPLPCGECVWLGFQNNISIDFIYANV